MRSSAMLNAALAYTKGYRKEPDAITQACLVVGLTLTMSARLESSHDMSGM